MRSSTMLILLQDPLDMLPIITPYDVVRQILQELCEREVRLITFGAIKVEDDTKSYATRQLWGNEDHRAPF